MCRKRFLAYIFLLALFADIGQWQIKRIFVGFCPRKRFFSSVSREKFVVFPFLWLFTPDPESNFAGGGGAIKDNK